MSLDQRKKKHKITILALHDNLQKVRTWGYFQARQVDKLSQM